MQENATRFLNAFVTVEMYLRKILKQNTSGFTNMVHAASKRYPKVKDHQVFLIEMSQLRNAIVHSHVGENHEVLAEPHLWVVEKLERIAKQLTAPTQLKDLKYNKVYVTSLDVSCSDLLKVQEKHNYSVVPVYDQGRYIGVIHNRLYQRFLEKNADALIDLKTVKVRDLLLYKNSDERIGFVSQWDTLDDAVNIYESLHRKGKGLIALIITDSGKPNDKILGILTPIDFVRIFSELELID